MTASASGGASRTARSARRTGSASRLAAELHANLIQNQQIEKGRAAMASVSLSRLSRLQVSLTLRMARITVVKALPVITLHDLHADADGQVASCRFRAFQGTRRFYRSSARHRSYRRTPWRIRVRYTWAPVLTTNPDELVTEPLRYPGITVFRCHACKRLSRSRVSASARSFAAVSAPHAGTSIDRTDEAAAFVGAVRVAHGRRRFPARPGARCQQWPS